MTYISKEISNFTEKFSKNLKKPQQRNFRELVKGLVFAKTSYLNQIGKISASENNDRKNTERLSNTLSKINVNLFSQIHIDSKINCFKNEPVLFLSDGGDIQKPHAKKMEKVAAVVDGSNGHKVGNGYPIHSIMAYGTETKQLCPLMLHLYSRKSEEYKSEFDEYKNETKKLIPFIKNSPFDKIFVEDRGCDDEKRFSYFLTELECSFVTRVNLGKNSRIVIFQNENGDFERINISSLSLKLEDSAEAKKTWENKKIKKKLKSKIAYKKVFLSQMPKIPLYLIFVYSEGFSQPLVVITDLKTENSEQAWKHFFYYKKRWEVENFYRAIKQNFNAESFLVRKFEKIQSLMFLFMMTYDFLNTLNDKLESFLGSLFVVFKSFCKKSQRSKTHLLDFLAFLREKPDLIFGSFFSRFCSVTLSKNSLLANKNQLNLFKFNKKW